MNNKPISPLEILPHGFTKGEGKFFKPTEPKHKWLEKNDIQKFIELYEGFGVKIKKPTLSGDGYEIQFPEDAIEGLEKFDGYAGLFTRIYFDKDGKFILQGFWE